MKTVTKRDLNQQTASVLSRVTDEQDIVVTEHGEPKWRLSIYRADHSPLAEMEKLGIYTPARSNPAPWPSQPDDPEYASDDVDTLLGELRGEH